MIFGLFKDNGATQDRIFDLQTRLFRAEEKAVVAQQQAILAETRAEQVSAVLKRRVLHCAFCGKDEHEVNLLMAGPRFHITICDECIELCHEVVVEKRTEGNKP